MERTSTPLIGRTTIHHKFISAEIAPVGVGALMAQYLVDFIYDQVIKENVVSLSVAISTLLKQDVNF